ncbi:MAG: hypothetical protein AAF566_10780 [Pseudomonadota bacterium]
MRPTIRSSLAALLASFFVLLALVVPGLGQSAEGTVQVVPQIEIIEDERGLWQRLSAYAVDFQRKANAEVATHMNAIERGDDLQAFSLGLGIAFLYGVIHAFGPGHGKFIIVSYFLGRDTRVGRGVLMAVQVAIVHVAAAVLIVWLADVLLRSGTGMGLAEVPGVRAGSFLIIAVIGLYMLYQAMRAALGYIDASEVGHGHSHSGTAHGHSHGHAHAEPARAATHSHSHSHGHGDLAHGSAAQTHHSPGKSGVVEASQVESSLMAFAAGVVPCPGAVLIMLYAVANNMIYPGFLLVGAMSVGIGLTICLLGVGAIMARQTATRIVSEGGGGGGRVVILRHVLNFGGAIIVTLIGVVSFIAFLDFPVAG